MIPAFTKEYPGFVFCGHGENAMRLDPLKMAQYKGEKYLSIEGFMSFAQYIQGAAPEVAEKITNSLLDINHYRDMTQDTVEVVALKGVAKMKGCGDPLIDRYVIYLESL